MPFSIILRYPIPPFIPSSPAFSIRGAAGLFLGVCLKTLKKSTEPKGIQDNFLLAGMVWFLVSGIIYSILNLQLFLGAFPSENPLVAGSVPPYLFSAWVQLFLMGFVFNFILGISSKTIPILREAGFEKITNPLLRKTLGRAMTVKKACEEQRIDFNLLKRKIEMEVRR